MSTRSESSEQATCRVPECRKHIFEGANRDQTVPVLGDVHDPLVPWHLLHAIDTPRPPQEKIQQTAMIQHAAIMLGMKLSEPCFFGWDNRSILFGAK